MANNLYAFTLQTVEVATGSPETVVNDSVAANPLGALMKWGDNVYRYVQSSTGVGAVATAAKGVAYWKTLTLNADLSVWLATSDQSDGLGSGSLSVVAGIYKGVVTTLYYTFLGVGGVHSCTTVSGMAAGDTVIGSTTDLTFGRIAAGASAPGSVVYGTAIAAQASSANNVLLANLIW